MFGRVPAGQASIDGSYLEWVLLCCWPNGDFSNIFSTFLIWLLYEKIAFSSWSFFIHSVIYIRVDSHILTLCHRLWSFMNAVDLML